ncbi:MAG TPA: hypothetical protein VMV07_07345 [Streptosporangiaceae bacterium]|nr:hypothetical protein [Streptosporangiaceae bacterium]
MALAAKPSRPSPATAACTLAAGLRDTVRAPGTAVGRDGPDVEVAA